MLERQIKKQKDEFDAEHKSLLAANEKLQEFQRLEELKTKMRGEPSVSLKTY